VAGENIFTGMINMSGEIYDYRNKIKVGVDLQREAELMKDLQDAQEIADRYYGLYGALPPVKTAETIAQEAAAEQAEINKQLMGAILNLSETVEELKKNNAKAIISKIETVEPEPEVLNEKSLSQPLVGRTSNGRFAKKGA
jgi:hypothetical protein